MRDEVRATLDRIMAKLQQDAGAAAGGARGGQVGTWAHSGSWEMGYGTRGRWWDVGQLGCNVGQVGDGTAGGSWGASRRTGGRAGLFVSVAGTQSTG